MVPVLWVLIIFWAKRISAMRSDPISEEILTKLTNSSMYNKQATPTQYMEIPTYVNISMYIEGISTFRAVTMDFQLDMYFQQKWYDARLQHSNPTRILIKDLELLHRMWYPDLYFANAKLAEFHEVTQANFLLWIYPNGTIFYDTRISLVVMCMMDLAKWPLDKQHCNLRILSYAYDTEQLWIEWIEQLPIDRNQHIRMPDMHLLDIITGRCNGTYSTGVWSCVTAEFYVKREIMHHLVQSYLPTALIVVISWFSFWLDVDAVPARVSLSITTLLTLSTQANAARMALPEVSYMKAIDVWMGTCMAFVFGVMIEFTAANYAQRQEEKSSDFLEEKCKRKPSFKEHRQLMDDGYDIRLPGQGEKVRAEEEEGEQKLEGFRGALNRIRSFRKTRKMGQANGEKFILRPVLETQYENANLLANSSDFDGETTDEERRTFSKLQRVLEIRKQAQNENDGKRPVKQSVKFDTKSPETVHFDQQNNNIEANNKFETPSSSPQIDHRFVAIGIPHHSTTNSVTPVPSPQLQRPTPITKLKSSLKNSSDDAEFPFEKNSGHWTQLKSISTAKPSGQSSDLPQNDEGLKVRKPSGWSKVKKVTSPTLSPMDSPDPRAPSPQPKMSGWGKFRAMSTTAGSEMFKKRISTTDKWITAVKQLQTNRKLMGREAAKRIDQKSRWGFPVAFTLFNIFYWVFYLYLFQNNH